MQQKLHENLIDQISESVAMEMKIPIRDLLTDAKELNFPNLERIQLFTDESSNATSKDVQRRALTTKRKLANKVFRARDSPLTDMMAVRHIKTIYHIFVVMLIILFLYTVVHDLVDTGIIYLGFRPIIAGFGKFHIALMLWCCMQTSTFLLYPCFRMWAANHRNCKQGKLWDWTALVLFVSYQCGFIVAAIKAHLWFDLPPASGVTYLMEMTRLLMKAHAFVRSNVPKALISRTSDETIHANTFYVLPSFAMYVYFMFVPTLVYRDEYPRTRQIRWRIVLLHAIEVVGTVLFMSFILERLLAPLYENFGPAQISSGNLIKTLFCSFMPSTLFLLCFFYCSLHAWMNGAAELLRFADRMFYRDWWNESTFAGYIRSWNVVVHDWLYTYVYKDCVEHVFRNCRPLATVAVFTVSAVFHELILAFTFRFFYPVMFVQFEFLGLLLMFVTKRMGKDVGNVLLWLMLSIGNGLHLSLYNMEYYARRNCPDIGDSIVDYMVPVSWSCNGITHNPNWTFTAPWSLP
ncbi:sterol O-acyltransferase 1-like [Anopheles marshallii]|uniref:sterol O-acyltransferase 1-like n=1 Tax=Anopheles marshallii TaxID=1521116 RepID=UPI00237B68BF|nr:sterol O-acyltransferase 1-like [Anopheles marshallii]